MTTIGYDVMASVSKTTNVYQQPPARTDYRITKSALLVAGASS